MFAFILESLGATELIFILAIALIFFGPRKLPQLARSMGKAMSEFRKASDDFKRTWEREVALETPVHEQSILGAHEMSQADNTDTENADATVAADPQLEPANPDWAVPREGSPYAATSETAAESSPEPEPVPVPVPAETNQPEPLRKHDWL